MSSLQEEVLKAVNEGMINGVSFIMYDINGKAKHIPFKEIFKTIREVNSRLSDGFQCKDLNFFEKLERNGRGE